jgi:hypothetical protein
VKWVGATAATLRRVLNYKLFDNPPWFAYLPFASHVFTAALLMCASPVGIWFSLRMRRDGLDLMTRLNANTSDPVAQPLYWMPLFFLAMSIGGAIIGLYALRAACREWRGLRTAHGFEVVRSAERQ